MEREIKSAEDIRFTTSVSSPPFDVESYSTLDRLSREGLCVIDENVGRVHQAVFDAQRERLELTGAKNGSKKLNDDSNNPNELNKHILSLTKEAANFCMMCSVNDICYDYGVKAAKYVYGVFGALSGPQRRTVANENKLPQQEFPRNKGTKVNLAKAV
jgi:hypothetical protein